MNTPEMIPTDFQIPRLIVDFFEPDLFLQVSLFIENLVRNQLKYHML